MDRSRALARALGALATLTLALGASAEGARVASLELTGIEPATADPDDPISEDELRERLLTSERGLRFWRERPAFDARTLEQDLDRVRRYYRSHGYYEVEAASQVQLDDEGELADVAIAIVPGEPARVATFELSIDDAALAHLTPDERAAIESAAAIGPGDFFSPRRYERARDALLEALAEHGHARAGIEGGARVLLEARAAHIDWRVVPGPRIEIGEIRITGLERVADRHVRKAIARLAERGVREGDRHAPSRLRATQRAISDLGLFRSVAVRAIEPEDDEARAAQDAATTAVWPIEIAVEERPRRGIRVGGGYGTEERFRVRGEWEHRNLFGEGERLEVSGKYSSLVAAGRVRFLDPSFIEPDVEAELPVAFEHETEPAAHVDRASAELLLRIPVGHDVVARAGYRFERAEVVKRFADLAVFDPAAPLQPDTFLLGSAIFGLRRARVDDLFEPTRGSFLDLELRPTLRALGSDVDFLRWRAAARGYVPWRALVFAARFEIGAIHPLRSTRELDVPVFERFFAGGSTSVRGYDYHLVGPLDAEGDPLGGLSWAEAAFELRFPIWGPVGGVAFVDAGTVERRPAHWFRDVFPGAGGGIRIATPVGPVRLDVGVPLDGGDRIERYEIHFSVGHAF